MTFELDLISALAGLLVGVLMSLSLVRIMKGQRDTARAVSIGQYEQALSVQKHNAILSAELAWMTEAARTLMDLHDADHGDGMGTMAEMVCGCCPGDMCPRCRCERAGLVGPPDEVEDPEARMACWGRG